MRWLIVLVLVAAVIGCKSSEAVPSDSGAGAPTKPAKYPGGTGLSGGQSGTGTTSGASTGY